MSVRKQKAPQEGQTKKTHTNGLKDTFLGKGLKWRRSHLYFEQAAGKEELLVPTCFVKGKKVFGRSFTSVTLIAEDYLPTLVLYLSHGSTP